jgi:hypothetical protein
VIRDRFSFLIFPKLAVRGKLCLPAGNLFRYLCLLEIIPLLSILGAWKVSELHFKHMLFISKNKAYKPHSSLVTNRESGCIITTYGTHICR